MQWAHVVVVKIIKLHLTQPSWGNALLLSVNQKENCTTFWLKNCDSCANMFNYKEHCFGCWIIWNWNLANTQHRIATMLGTFAEDRPSALELDTSHINFSPSPFLYQLFVLLATIDYWWQKWCKTANGNNDGFKNSTWSKCVSQQPLLLPPSKHSCFCSTYKIFFYKMFHTFVAGESRVETFHVLKGGGAIILWSDTQEERVAKFWSQGH